MIKHEEPVICIMQKQIFLGVILKESMAGTSPARPSYRMAPTIKYNL